MNLNLQNMGPFSNVAPNRLRKLLKRYCNNLDVRLAFSSFKISNMFSVKDPVELRSNVVLYKFTHASCNACYVSETSWHLSARIREHLNMNIGPHISFNILNNPTNAAIRVLPQATQAHGMKFS